MDDQRIQDDEMELEKRNAAVEGLSSAEENEQDIVKKGERHLKGAEGQEKVPHFCIFCSMPLW